VYIRSVSGDKIDLDLVIEDARAAAPGRSVLRSPDILSPIQAISNASRAFFIDDPSHSRSTLLARATRLAEGPREAGPAVVRDTATGLVRTTYREVVVRWKPRITERSRHRALRALHLERARENLLVANQWVVADPQRRLAGAALITAANHLAESGDAIFATPNFVSQYVRSAPPRINRDQWHLANAGRVQGQVRHEDVAARPAWIRTRGKGIVIAVLDDGVDIEHPSLKPNVWKNPDLNAPDVHGRDFFLPNDHPDHFNPRPKTFRVPYGLLDGNDNHGTPCAGVAAAASGVPGVAPEAKILAVKIFHADELAEDERVADAIRYAALHADVISCSWSGPYSPDVEQALIDVQSGRNGRGTAVYCATGNDYRQPVGFPARASSSIGVGASTDMATLAAYSNVGPEVDFVAPSSGGIEAITTTDVSYQGRGFNLGDAATGGVSGLRTNQFGGTSSATPLAAGVGALVLSVASHLSREDLRGLMRETCDQIGGGYDADGHSIEYGFGRVSAARAVASVP
jgi:subtilisin family serine protease